MNKESEKDCFKGFNKIFVLLLIPIFVGYIIFEVQKIDTIRIKKMESFEIVIDSFNEISKKAFSDNAISAINLIYNTLILTVDSIDITKDNNHLKKSILDLKLEKLKMDQIVSNKQLEVESEILFTKIQHHENLLKSYYGYSINDNILPISKMLWIIQYNNKLKKTVNQSLIDIIEDIKPLLFRQVTINSIEEAKEIQESIKEKVDNWILKQNEIFTITQKLGNLFRKESAKLYDDIYNTHTEELNTPIFGLYTEKNKEKFSKIVYSTKNKDIRLQVLEDNNGDFYFKEFKK